MRDVLPCDWPQCECAYDCERNYKHEEFLRDLREDREAHQALAELEQARDAHG